MYSGAPLNPKSIYQTIINPNPASSPDIIILKVLNLPLLKSPLRLTHQILRQMQTLAEEYQHALADIGSLRAIYDSEIEQLQLELQQCRETHEQDGHGGSPRWSAVWVCLGRIRVEDGRRIRCSTHCICMVVPPQKGQTRTTL